MASFVTVTSQCASTSVFFSSSVTNFAVIRASPSFRPLTTPLSETSATVSRLLDHSIFGSESRRVVPLSSLTLTSAMRLISSSGAISALSMEREISKVFFSSFSPPPPKSTEPSSASSASSATAPTIQTARRRPLFFGSSS